MGKVFGLLKRLTWMLAVLALTNKGFNMDVKNTKEALEFAMALGTAGGKSYADKKLSPSDAIYFYDTVVKLPAAIDDADLIISEIKDLSDEEKAELHEVVAHLDLPDDQKEAFIEQGIKLAVDIAQFALLTASYIKQ